MLYCYTTITHENNPDAQRLTLQFRCQLKPGEVSPGKYPETPKPNNLEKLPQVAYQDPHIAHGVMPGRGVLESLSYRSSVGDPQAPQGGLGC